MQHIMQKRKRRQRPTRSRISLKRTIQWQGIARQKLPWKILVIVVWRFDVSGDVLLSEPHFNGFKQSSVRSIAITIYDEYASLEF